jgi:hypothetical protein
MILAPSSDQPLGPMSNGETLAQPPRPNASAVDDLSQRPEIQVLIAREEARRPIEHKRERALVELNWTRRDRRRFLQVSQAVIMCPTRLRPGQPEKGEHHHISTGGLPSGDVVEVEYASRVARVGVLGGADEALFDAICSEFLKARSPLIRYQTAAQLMDNLGLAKRYPRVGRRSGGRPSFRYRELNARLARVAATVMTLRRPGLPDLIVRVVDIDNVQLQRAVAALEWAGQRRPFPYVLRLAPEFYEDLLRWRFRVPEAVIRAFVGNPTQYRFAKWLLYRATWGQPTEISLKHIARERGITDSNPRRVRAKVRRALDLLTKAWPPAQEVFGLHKNPRTGEWRLRLNPHRAQEHLIGKRRPVRPGQHRRS